jgi:hypothetical protein
LDLKEIGSDGVEWIHLAQDMVLWGALVNKVNELSGSIKGGEFLWKDQRLSATQQRICTVELDINDIYYLHIYFRTCTNIGCY